MDLRSSIFYFAIHRKYLPSWNGRDSNPQQLIEKRAVLPIELPSHYQKAPASLGLFDFTKVEFLLRGTLLKLQ